MNLPTAAVPCGHGRASRLHERQFREAHRLQPDNWTYKRQAWSLVSVETQPGPRARLRQWPAPEQLAAWPFESDFQRDLEKTPRGDYYPDTMAED